MPDDHRRPSEILGLTPDVQTIGHEILVLSLAGGSPRDPQVAAIAQMFERSRGTGRALEKLVHAAHDLAARERAGSQRTQDLPGARVTARRSLPSRDTL